MKTILWVFPIKDAVVEAQEMGYKVAGIFPKTINSPAYVKTRERTLPLCDLSLVTDDFETGNMSDELIQFITQTNFSYVLNTPIDQYLPFSVKIVQFLKKSDNNADFYPVVMNKFNFRNFLQSKPELAPLNPHFSRATNKEQLREKLHSTPLPVIVKPSSTNGSKDIFCVESVEDIEPLIAYWDGHDFPDSLNIEEKIEGIQYSVETMSVNGQHQILGVTQKTDVTPPYFVEVGGHFPADLESNLLQTLKEKIFFFLNAIDYKVGFTHTEFFVTPRGEIKIVESHLRMPGIIPSLFREIYGVSWHGHYLESLEKGHPLDLPETAGEVCLIDVFEFLPDQELKLGETPHWMELTQIVFRLRADEPVKPVTCNLERHGYFIVKGRTLDEAKEKATIIRSRIHDSIGKIYDR